LEEGETTVKISVSLEARLLTRYMEVHCMVTHHRHAEVTELPLFIGVFIPSSVT
jgi:hypothetical protein